MSSEANKVELESAPVSGRALKILVVDDDPVIQKLLTAALKKTFEVVTESMGANVLSRAGEVRPDLILLDLGMPNVDGYEVLNLLKQHAELSSVPVICVSGKEDEASRMRAYKAGAAGFILKPINVAQVAQDISKLLSAMNSELHSTDGKRSVFIGYSEGEVSARLRADVEKWITSGKKVLVISPSEGEVFFEDQVPTALRSGELIFLQAKAALIKRLPYLENLTSVTDDIRGLMPAGTKPDVVCIEAPDKILNLNDQERSGPVSLLFAETMKNAFGEVHYYAKAAGSDETGRSLGAMAKTLIGK